MAGTLPGPLGVGANQPQLDAGTMAMVDHHVSQPVGLQVGAHPKKASDDDAVARLRAIRKLVQENNRSTLDENVVICQIYMESRFDAKAGAGHDAKGLLQMQLNALKQVYKYREQKKLGHMPSDKATVEAFKQATAFHATPAMMDEDVNIQLGTEYMQYWIDVTSTLEEAYKKYRGRPDGIYYKKIKAAAEKLAKDPESMQVLRDMVK